MDIDRCYRWLKDPQKDPVTGQTISEPAYQQLVKWCHTYLNGEMVGQINPQLSKFLFSKKTQKHRLTQQLRHMLRDLDVDLNDAQIAYINRVIYELSEKSRTPLIQSERDLVVLSHIIARDAVTGRYNFLRINDSFSTYARLKGYQLTINITIDHKTPWVLPGTDLPLEMSIVLIDNLSQRQIYQPMGNLLTYPQLATLGRHLRHLTDLVLTIRGESREILRRYLYTEIYLMTYHPELVANQVKYYITGMTTQESLSIPSIIRKIYRGFNVDVSIEGTQPTATDHVYEHRIDLPPYTGGDLFQLFLMELKKYDEKTLTRHQLQHINNLFDAIAHLDIPFKIDMNRLVAEIDASSGELEINRAMMKAVQSIKIGPGAEGGAGEDAELWTVTCDSKSTYCPMQDRKKVGVVSDFYQRLKYTYK